MLLLASDFKANSNRSLKLSINNDYKKVIDAFLPELIVAESAKENAVVIDEALRSLSSFAVINPDLTKISIDKFNNDLQKVILLNKDSKDAEVLSQYGLVVYSVQDYEKEYKSALNNVL